MLTIPEIAKKIGRHRLVVRNWIIWDKDNKYLPKPAKIIGDGRKTRLYEDTDVEKFEAFKKLVRDGSLMKDFNTRYSKGESNE